MTFYKIAQAAPSHIVVVLVQKRWVQKLKKNTWNICSCC